MEMYPTNEFKKLLISLKKSAFNVKFVSLYLICQTTKLNAMFVLGVTNALSYKHYFLNLTIFKKTLFQSFMEVKIPFCLIFLR